VSQPRFETSTCQIQTYIVYVITNSQTQRCTWQHVEDLKAPSKDLRKEEHALIEEEHAKALKGTLFTRLVGESDNTAKTVVTLMFALLAL
jgi:hypothetical protein